MIATKMLLSGVPVRYGAAELKMEYRRFMLRALILSSFIHFVLLGTYWVKVRLFPDRTPIVHPRPLVFRNGAVFYPPPSIQTPITITPSVHAGAGSTSPKVKIGIPVPVPNVTVEGDWSAEPATGGPQGIGWQALI